MVADKIRPLPFETEWIFDTHDGLFFRTKRTVWRILSIQGDIVTCRPTSNGDDVKPTEFRLPNKRYVDQITTMLVELEYGGANP